MGAKSKERRRQALTKQERTAAQGTLTPILVDGVGVRL